MYFIISNTPSGGTTIESITKEELLERLNNKYYGDGVNVIEHITGEIEVNRFSIAIIKGNLVVPKLIKTFDID